MSFATLPHRCLAAAALTAGSVVLPGRAMAEGPLAWDVVLDASCGPRGRELAREVELACDAVGHGCRVAAGPGVERRAVVTCTSDTHWTLEAQSEAGARLWTVALDGAVEGRLRTAAMWIARAERDAPPPDAPVISVAPLPPPLARAAVPATAAPFPAPPAPPSEAPRPGPAGESSLTAARATSDREPAARSLAPSPRRGGLAVSARGSVAGGLAPAAIGASARAVLGLPAGANAGLVIAADRAIGEASGFGLTTARAAASLGWGAPWTADGTLGASIEVGPVLGVVGAPSDVAPSARGFVDAYAQLEVYGRARDLGSLRPWIAVAVAGLAAPLRVSEGSVVASLPRVSGAVDVGVAWAGW